ncbi:TetR/AcrR family transcriptional regulator [Agromyces sp. LHK192]|uniref:TetR/AcrR family transcriptional regulator n=1 Tax=Agromyces sp. LHK192 TaxID=2498704 RepID=UPI000FDAF1C3|nr:WHG domain-containing protein [Agromyces sp. LHK192]
MPTPSRTSAPQILDAATLLLDRGGVDAVTMQAVAAEVGVRAPSLYKHVRNRDALLKLVAERAAADLGVALDGAAAELGRSDGTTPDSLLLELLRAARAFAHARPEAYLLVFARLPDGARPDRGVLRDAAGPLLAATAAAVGPADALAAARLLTAWVHGFVSMELSGAFRLGDDRDDVDAAFEYGARRLVDSLG